VRDSLGFQHQAQTLSPELDLRLLSTLSHRTENHQVTQWASAHKTFWMFYCQMEQDKVGLKSAVSVVEGVYAVILSHACPEGVLNEQEFRRM
jgi:hypothetical protein